MPVRPVGKFYGFVILTGRRAGPKLPLGADMFAAWATAAGADVMGARAKAFLLLFILGSAFCLGAGTAQAQFMTLVGAGTVALKSNETIELGDVYWVSKCRSMLKSTPEVEVLDGPPQVSATIKEAMVLPRKQSCAKPVAGGKLSISAKDIEDPSYTRITLRVLYRTKDGDRKYSHVFNLQLLP